MDKNTSNQRKSQRIATNIKVVFICAHFQYLGTVKNCSKDGMCISTKYNFSCDNNIEIIVPLQEEGLNLSGRILRAVKGDNLYETIGIELLNPHKEYLNYLDSLRYS
jgi:hypothetical protein